MTIPAEQQDVARFLADLARVPARETHISAIFIGADTVWKVKKAIRMPFLDFRTLRAREYFLRRELELNQPFAPDLYRAVVGIERRADGTLAFGSTNPIEFALAMSPVPPSDFLDVIAAQGALTTGLLDALGDAIAAYHNSLSPVTIPDHAGAMLHITEGNERSALAAGLPPGDVRSWCEAMRAAIEACRPWLSDRFRSGFIRRCHGDLHLGNICLWKGKPVPFDALEFDENLATIDVGYDLAFLLMDLDRRVGRPAANRVMNRYIARTGDIGAAAGFPIYLSQRAMIRAHVLTATGQDGTNYLKAAKDYLLPTPRAVVAIGGLQGSGKSTLARDLAPSLGSAPGALIIRSDEVRKRIFGLPPERRLPPEAYSEEANAETNAALIGQIQAALVARNSIIVDASFLNSSIKDYLVQIMDDTGTAFVGIWLEAPISLLKERVSARSGDASDATVEVLLAAAARNPGAGDWLTIDARDRHETLRAARDAIFNASGL